MVEKPLVIEIDMNEKCIRCGKDGATQSGYCLECHSKRITSQLRKERRAMGKPDVVQGEGDIIDVHPRIKNHPDGRIERYLDVKVRIPHHDPGTIAVLSGLLNTSVTITIAPVQISLIQDRKGK